ncbi:putative RNA methyltransferase [Lactococcus allomyrinae]|uniref:Methyltransferase domain-containing protein n=1 Tax=Lactococcus allomyrinae TaxID=2419773 RepID=A0A387BDQ3_9LACT|nr:methyltransferase domain-containing protein [Lactococcus allomyrinae]AYG00192.1 methyltransferase domain-containing protein [Lactococcus allomyrinae]
MNEILKCPVCDQALTPHEKTYECSNHHSFDCAKEGYLNLLLNAKKTAGDSKEMMAARRNFLAKGYYEKLSDHINTHLQAVSTDKSSVIDIGCGEGYYLSRFQRQMAHHADQFYGLDISKLGIRMAAKKNPDIHWLVANFSKLPFTDHSISSVLSMFAEYSVEEIDRVLADKGTVIIVRAASDHLLELKNIIYPEIHEKVKAASIKYFPGYHVERENYRYKTTIKTTDDLLSLLLMTPHYWKIKPDGIDKLKTYKELEITVSIEIDCLTRQFH